MVKNRRVAQLLGYGAIIAGSWLLYDAYERRGRTRPWGTKLLPGP
jgi:hypothetical protein